MSKTTLAGYPVVFDPSMRIGEIRMRPETAAELQRLGLKDMVAIEAPQRPPFETFTGATCKGSYALGSACGRCERCAWERAVMNQ